jgi:transcription initiation factor TFIIIB Brf1 subunit/transcription initiation factor TFIIB
LETPVIDDDNKFSFATEKDHNVSSNSFMSFNFIGKNSYCYQRSFLKTCANYSSFRRNNNRKDLYNYNYQYEGKKIPKNVIKLAIDIFSKIKDHNYVYRGNGKKGVLGACLFYACVMNNITKTPREIASIMEIEERFLSQGDRTIQELNEDGIINIPTILRPLQDYLDQYFPALEIPDKYKQFVFDIIERAEKKNIHIVNDSRPTTKCIGAIFLLVNRVKSLNRITKDKITSECRISKSTFIRYYNLLISNYKKIKPVFVKHRIPQPVAWRKIKSV